MIKEVFGTFGAVVADIEEKEDSYVLKNPLTMIIAPGSQQGVSFTFVPLSMINPITNLTIPKEHIYNIADLTPEIIKSYEDFVVQLKAAVSGIDIGLDNTSGGNIKKIIN